MTLEADKIERIIEAALLAADGPLTVASLVKLFAPGELDAENASPQVREALKVLTERAEDRGVELIRVASGYRYQVRQELSEWVSRLWDEKPPRYTRALLETLALVAYKQPVTRGDIEQVRGVSVSQNIMRTLMERDWIKVVGQREVPGRPSLYGTTKTFLDYFSLKSLNELPPLAEIRQLIEPAVAAFSDDANEQTNAAGQEGGVEQGEPEAGTGGGEDETFVARAAPMDAAATEPPELDDNVEVEIQEVERKESADVVPLHSGIQQNT